VNAIRIEPYQSGREMEIYQLVRRVYDEFVAHEYTEEGNRVFYDWIADANIAQRQKDRINLWMAFIDAKLVGVIEIRDNNHIALLFVDKLHHGRGIAKKLLHEAVKNCLQSDPELEAFHVNASPYSVTMYKKMGFVATNSMQVKFGIKYMPMEMKIKSSDNAFKEIRSIQSHHV
jgi:GNAT superfamily N-acetyltransferase